MLEMKELKNTNDNSAVTVHYKKIRVDGDESIYDSITSSNISISDGDINRSSSNRVHFAGAGSINKYKTTNRRTNTFVCFWLLFFVVLYSGFLVLFSYYHCNCFPEFDLKRSKTYGEETNDRKFSHDSIRIYDKENSGSEVDGDLEIVSRIYGAPEGGFCCKSNVDEDPFVLDKNKKRRLRLVITKSLLFFCTYTKDEQQCFKELQEEYDLHKGNNFFDIYYNFVINSNGDIYEGRSIDGCRFCEGFLPDHSEIITIGIGYCFDDGNAKEFKKSDNEYDAVKKLTRYLKKHDKLRADFEIQMSDECRNSTLYERLKSIFKITFYDSSIYRADSESVVKESIRDSIHLPGSFIDDGYDRIGNPREVWNNVTVEVTITDYVEEERVLGPNSDTGCHYSAWEKLDKYLKPNYVAFLNGSYCETDQKERGRTINILMLEDFPTIENDRKVNISDGMSFKKKWKNFLTNIIKMSEAIKIARNSRLLKSRICHTPQSSDLDTFSPFLALVFNADQKFTNNFSQLTDCLTEPIV